MLCLCEQNAVNRIEFCGGKPVKCIYKDILVLVYYAFVLQESDQCCGCGASGHLILFGQNIDALYQHPFEDDGPFAANSDLLEKGLGQGKLLGDIPQQVAEHNIGIREHFNLS